MSKNQYLHFKKGKFSFAAYFVLGMFILLSLTLIFKGRMFGIFFLIPVAIMLGVREGVYIDVANRRYKSYLSTFGMDASSWKPIPEGTRIGIRVLKLVGRRAVGRIVTGAESTNTTFELYLYMPRPERIVLGTGDNVEKLYFEAQNLSQLLGHEIFVDQRIPEEMYMKTR